MRQQVQHNMYNYIEKKIHTQSASRFPIVEVCVEIQNNYCTHCAQVFQEFLISAWYLGVDLLSKIRHCLCKGIHSCNETNVEGTLSDKETLCHEFEWTRSGVAWGRLGQESLMCFGKTRFISCEDEQRRAVVTDGT